MGINELYDGITKVVERFAEEIAEQKLLEREQKTGRGLKVKGEKTKKRDGKKKGINPNFPKTD